MDHIQVKFPLRLQRTRTKRGMEVSEIARKLDMSESGYRHYESGQREPSLTRVVHLSKILKVSVDYLLTGGETPYAAQQEKWNHQFL